MNIGNSNINPLPSKGINFSLVKGDTLRLSSSFPNNEPDPHQSSLRVYLDISTTNFEQLPDDLSYNDDFILFDKYRSILSRLQYNDFDLVDNFTLDLKEISKKLRWIDRRLSRPFLSTEEREQLVKEAQKYVKLSQKMLNEFSNSLNIYADRYLIDVPLDYAKLVKKLGYSSETLSLNLWFNKGSLSILLDSGESHSFDFAYISRAYAGKYHPAKGIFKGSQEAKRLMKDLLTLSKLISGNLYSYRKGKASPHTTIHNLIPVRHFVFTGSKTLSYFLWDKIRNGDDKALKTFKEVTAKTLKAFLSYLASKENISGDILFGFTVNIHVTGDKNPFEPHFHSHCLTLFICFDKKQKRWFRFNPILNKDDLDKLREFWKTNLIEAFGKGVFAGDLEKEFNVWVSDQYHSLPLAVAPIFFELKYASRKLFTNYANYFEAHDFENSYIEDPDFVNFVFNYENRTERYGFLTNIKRYIKLSCGDILDKHIKDLEYNIRLIEDDLKINGEFMSDDLKSKLFLELESNKKELENLKLKGLNYLIEKIQNKILDQLSNENINKEKIVNFLNLLFKAQGKRIIEHTFHSEYEDLPLYELLDLLEDPKVLLVNDRHPSLEFIWLNCNDYG